MDTEFHPIDIRKWERGEIFYYFSKMAPTSYSITVSMDVTEMRKNLKSRELKFFPSYLYIVTKLLNQQMEFKIADKDGVLGYWDTLTPLYASFHEDDKTFSLMWTEYRDNFMGFYQQYLENKINYGSNHGALAQKDSTPPLNSYTISCIPWIKFQHFSLHSYENKPYYFPTVESGKIYEDGARYMLPLSITLHHAATDGYHVKVFLEKLQEEMNHPEHWIII